MAFNKAQMQAINHKKGPCMVLAGPGSGKTTVITNRILHLIQKEAVRPEEILVVTFSRAAAEEMKQRFYRLTGSKTLPVTFGTFHGIFFGILKKAYGLTAEHILGEERRFQILQQILEQNGDDIDDFKEAAEHISEEIAKAKNSKNFSFEDEETRTIYEHYEKERNRIRKLDFEDMLLLTDRLFKDHPEILDLWQKRFRYILIDEFQDINPVQYDVVRKLALPENNLFVVGDDDQSIYGFRGSDPEIMLNFHRDYPGAKVITLDVNYRSTKNIVSVSGQIIRKNRKRYGKQMISPGLQGNQIHIQETKNPFDEGEYVAGEIQKLLSEGTPAEEIGVIFRTNEDGRVLSEILLEHGIDYSMNEHIPNIYEHFIARDFFAYLKMAEGNRERSTVLRVINRPNRYIGREALETGEVSMEGLKKYYRTRDWMVERIEDLERDLKVLGRCKPFTAIRYIRRNMGYDEFLEEYADKYHMNADNLLEKADEIEKRAGRFETFEEFFSYIKNYGDALRRREGEEKTKREGISLMTMHGSKGLEFDTVFIIQANDGVTPYKKAKTAKETEEERRMFYVAMTRAKRRLVISFVREKNGRKKQPSPYICELMNKK